MTDFFDKLEGELRAALPRAVDDDAAEPTLGVRRWHLGRRSLLLALVGLAGIGAPVSAGLLAVWKPSVSPPPKVQTVQAGDTGEPASCVSSTRPLTGPETTTGGPDARLVAELPIIGRRNGAPLSRDDLALLGDLREINVRAVAPVDALGQTVRVVAARRARSFKPLPEECVPAPQRGALRRQNQLQDIPLRTPGVCLLGPEAQAQRGVFLCGNLRTLRAGLLTLAVEDTASRSVVVGLVGAEVAAVRVSYADGSRRVIPVHSGTFAYRVTATRRVALPKRIEWLDRSQAIVKLVVLGAP